jgi:hypothetical protein
MGGQKNGSTPFVDQILGQAQEKPFGLVRDAMLLASEEVKPEELSDAVQGVILDDRDPLPPGFADIVLDRPLVNALENLLRIGAKPEDMALVKKMSSESRRIRKRAPDLDVLDLGGSSFKHLLKQLVDIGFLKAEGAAEVRERQ